MSGKSEITKDGLHQIVMQNSKIESSLGEIIIITTVDKVELCLMRYLKYVGVQNGWIAPLGILLTVILTFLTTNFKEWLFPKEVWQAFFILSAVLLLFWLLKSLWLITKRKSVDDVLNDIKKSSIDIREDDRSLIHE